MNWITLFTSLEGRIGRKKFWIGMLILSAIGAVISFVTGPILGGGMRWAFSELSLTTPPSADTWRVINARLGWYSLFMSLIFAWPYIALIVKRRHDRGSNGYEVWVLFGLQILGILIQISGIGMSFQEINGVTHPVPNLLGIVPGIGTGILGIYVFVVAGFLRGDSGDNRFGPDPLAVA